MLETRAIPRGRWHARVVRVACVIMTVAGVAVGLAQARTAADALEDDPRLSTFRAIVERAGLVDHLRSIDLITVFAPTEAAFERLDPSVVDALRSDPEMARAFIAIHTIDHDLIHHTVSGLAVSNGAVNPVDEVVALPEKLRGDPPE